MAEQSSGRLLDQAQGQDSHSKRPPSQSRKRMGNTLLIVVSLAFGCLVFWNATRPFFYVGYFALSIVAWIRSMVRRRIRRTT